jgi:hypothetical protein
MLSLLANDYLAHCVELLEAEERTSEMMQNISMGGDATAIPEAPGKQTVPSSTNTSQEILGGCNSKLIYTFSKILTPAYFCTTFSIQHLHLIYEHHPIWELKVMCFAL